MTTDLGVLLYFVIAIVTFGVMLRIHKEECGYADDFGGPLVFSSIWPITLLGCLGYLIAHLVYKCTKIGKKIK